jgi:hypothetical protein
MKKNNGHDFVAIIIAVTAILLNIIIALSHSR